MGKDSQPFTLIYIMNVIITSIIILMCLTSCMKYPKKGTTNMDTDKQKKVVPFNLMEHLGIDESQVEVNASTPRKAKVILDNKDALQDEARTTIKEIMSKLGTEVSFTCLKRDGTQKDANGKPIKKDGKTVPRFVQTKLNGLWVIDERKEGDSTFYEVSRVHYYTESFTIAEYKEL